MDRLNGLIWIARDLGNNLDKLVDEHFHQIGSTTKGWASEQINSQQGERRAMNTIEEVS